MSNELTDVRCPCGDEYPADSYDAGFIAGSGMCQNCDAALPPKDICTCPSGDGSLRHPCPAHPAVEQACWDERKLSDLGNELHNLSCSIVHENEKLAEQIGGIARELWNWPQARAALAQPSPKCSTCGGTGMVDDGEIDCYSDGTPFENGPVKCVKDCPACKAQPSPAQAEQHWPKLEKPAQVGAICFSAGVSSRLVVEAAQRLYEFESTPEKEAERIERLQAFREQCFEPLGAEFSKVLSENLVELSSEAKPEQAEAERPEIVATLFTPNEKVHDDIGFKAFAVAGDCDKDGGEFYDPEKLMTVAQHGRIVGELRTEIAMLRSYESEWELLLNQHEQERDAALAEVECLRESKGDPSGSFDRCMKMMYERDENAKRLDAALARVAELTATRNRYGVDAHYFNKNLQRILRDFESFTPDELARSLIILAKVADEKVVAQAQHSVPDDVETFLGEVRAELLRARSKFPGDRIMTIALAEEFGELCKAVLDEPAANVRKEAVQTAVMAARVVLDGDGSVTAWRAERGLDPLAAAPGKEGL
ncbi:hypothetical protein ACMFER_21780 [Pseudomonas aeruginosa]|uniref:hypothetical protein n=1 Tax=Pseudomonas aeruginosa TaxID=287 RepID=UPI003CFCAEBC